MNTTIVWKVTINKKSWSHRVMESQYFPPLYYNLDEKTIPKVGRIFCFKNPSDIYEFLHESGFFCNSPFTSENLFIFSGIAEDPKIIKRVAKYACHIYYFWERKKKKKKPIEDSVLSAPKGTVSCASFYPTEQYSWSQFVEDFNFF